MKILNFGSLNIDLVYHVKSIARPGETIDSISRSVFPGGKGLNQSLAMARAGAMVWHAGMIGDDGDMLINLLKENSVNCEYIKKVPKNTGCAFIQVDSAGQNSIVLDGGANRTNSIEWIDEVLKNFGEGDIIVLQNEINLMKPLIEKSYDKKMFIVLNPSPMNKNITDCDLKKINLFIMNEHEGAMITGRPDANSILETMRYDYPESKVVLTLGVDGVLYQDNSQIEQHSAYKVKAVDTTAAGDTFAGYFVWAMSQGKTIKDCLMLASKAAALAVMKEGASSSIPYFKEVVSVSLEL